MSTVNPLEQLRRRMQAHATPTAFVALAEDHRRAGRFVDAITVCREGLERYPAYASARVTLGRALFDSGDVRAAVAELELAVAQSPDNLAAGRALQSALAALGDAPAPPVDAPTPFADLPLRAADGDTNAIHGDVIGRALSTGPDGPHEFGLGADWSIPDASDLAAPADPACLESLPAPDTPVDAADDEGLVAQTGPHTDLDVDGASSDASAQSPTQLFTPPHLQGDEPAGIWATPVAQMTTEAAGTGDGARVFSWAFDTPDASAHAVSAEQVSPEPAGPASVWDAPTIAAPLADMVEASFPSDAIASGAELPYAGPATNLEVLEASEPSPPAPAASDDVASPFWSERFANEVEGDTPEPFAGWGGEAPPTAASADRSPWADDAAPGLADTWTVPDGPSATWALGDLDEAAGADATPFKDSMHESDPSPVLFDNLPAAPNAPVDGVVPPAGVAWAGSVRSALGEVFALAGHGESLEPPPHASAEVSTAMANAAVEAAIEDAVLRHDGTSPALASLEQILAAVRARRAALSGGSS